MSKAELEAADKRLQQSLARLEQVMADKAARIAGLEQQLAAASAAQARQLAQLQELVRERDDLRDKAALLELDQARLPLDAALERSPDNIIDPAPLYAEIARLEAENKALRQTARDAARRVTDTIGRLQLAARV